MEAEDAGRISGLESDSANGPRIIMDSRKGDMQAMRVCAIVLNYNGLDLLGPCLDALLASDCPGLSAMLVDNASSDGSAEFVRRRYPQVELLENPENYYFSRGNNEGMRLALDRGADYLLVLNNDTLIDPSCVRLLIEFMDAHPRAGACQPLLRFMHRPDLAASAGIRLGMAGKAWDMACGEPAESLGRLPFQVLGATGGAMLLRAEALSQCGLFCEEFQMYFEDVDLSLRLREAGWDIWCVPEASVLHECSVTTNRTGSWRRGYFCERNSYKVVLRNYPPAKILKAYLLGWPMAGLVAGYNLLLHDRRYGLAIAQAMLEGLRDLVRFLPGRLSRRDRQARRYPFWLMIEESVIYPPNCRRADS